jgi:hypothetical protein
MPPALRRRVDGFAVRTADVSIPHAEAIVAIACTQTPSKHKGGTDNRAIFCFFGPITA